MHHIMDAFISHLTSFSMHSGETEKRFQQERDVLRLMGCGPDLEDGFDGGHTRFSKSVIGCYNRQVATKMFCCRLVWTFGVEANEKADIMTSLCTSSPCSLSTCMRAMWLLPAVTLALGLETRSVYSQRWLWGEISEPNGLKPCQPCHSSHSDCMP